MCEQERAKRTASDVEAKPRWSESERGGSRASGVNAVSGYATFKVSALLFIVLVSRTLLGLDRLSYSVNHSNSSYILIANLSNLILQT